MQSPAIPLDETQRLMSLQSLRILDTPSEERFDRLTRMAQRMFKVEICLISLVDSDRQWFKSRQGIDACETSREVSFCGHAILFEEIFIIEDAADDIRFADNPLVTGPPNLRFYAGCPVRGPFGHRIGTLCLIDSKPRSLSADDQETLKDMASLVEDELSATAQATIDDLTQVANRRGFKSVANHMLSLCRRTGTAAELLFFDLDGFKGINDDLGHAAGDAVLQHFAKLLVKCFRGNDVVARLGGDEFVVLMTATDRTSTAAIARLEELAQANPCRAADRLRWSVGSVRFDAERHDSIEALLSDADSSMYQHKASRRGA